MCNPLKAHVDTPRSDQMFGSRVVCLPTQFSGGALATCHHGREVKFNWSSPLESPRKTLSWAVFFSGVEHEVTIMWMPHVWWMVAMSQKRHCMIQLLQVVFRLEKRCVSLSNFYLVSGSKQIYTEM